MTSEINKYQKNVHQILFRPSISSLAEITTVAKEFEKYYEEWRVNNKNEITLFSPQNKEFLQLTPSMITYVTENSSIDEEKKEINTCLEKAFEIYINNFNIEEIRRIGTRTIQIYETNFSYEDLVDIINRKFYSNNPEMNSIIYDKIIDNVFSIDAIKNDLFNHIKIGPIKKQDIQSNIQNSFDLEIESFKENNMFVDIDIFLLSEVLTIKNTIEKMKSVYEENKKINQGLREYMFN